MKYCSQCGFGLSGNEKFCPNCANNLDAEDIFETPQRSPYEVEKSENPRDFRDDYVASTAQRQLPDTISESEEYVSSPRKNGWFIFGIIMCVLVIAAGAVVALDVFGVIDIIDYDFENDVTSQIVSDDESLDMVKVPKLIGLTQEEAEDKADRAGLELRVEYEESSDNADNVVIEQSPDASMSVQKGSHVTIVVNKISENTDSESEEDASASVQVPNITELTLEEAERQIKGKSLTLFIEGEEYSDTVPEGCIISQNPSSGTADKNSKVSVVVSKGLDMSNYVTMENYVGKYINDVEKDLEKEGLKVKYSYTDNDKYVKDVIVSQSSESGSIVKKGSTVSFTVSKGKPENSESSKKTEESNKYVQSQPLIKSINLTGAYNYSTNPNPVFTGISASSTLAPEGDYTYDPSNALKANTTCWAEGASGNGIGEYIMLTNSKTQTVSGCQIINGYVSDSTTFNNNSRMSRVKFEFSDGSTYTADIDPDYMALQRIEFPRPVQTTSLKIIIEDVKSGDKYQDTCITLILPY